MSCQAVGRAGTEDSTGGDFGGKMKDSFEEIDREVDLDMGWHKGQVAAARPKRSPPYVKALHWLKQKGNAFLLALGHGLRAVARVVFFPVISPLGYTKRFDIHGDMIVIKRSLGRRIFEGLLTRLVLTPVVLAIFFALLVYFSTHPEPILAEQTPEAQGLYFKRVTLISSDDQRLSAWYVPPIKAEELLINQEDILNQKWPAVVVSHGLGQSHEHYLSLAKSLHDAGFGILLLDLRGQGESAKGVVTFGIRERLDILAGVRYLRELPNIDPSKICLVGHDMAATSSLHAAMLDSSIKAVVADGLWPQFHQRVERIFDNSRMPTKWMAPLYDLAFEISLRERLDQIDPGSLLKSIHTQPVLFVAYNSPENASIPDLMNMAASVPAHHEVMVANSGDGSPAGGDSAATLAAVNQRVTQFLCTSANWSGPTLKGQETVRKLFENRVK